MGSWLQWFAALYPVVASLTPLLLFFGFLWLRTKFADVGEVAQIRRDVTDIKSRLDIIDVRLKDVDEDLDGEPTRLQVLQKVGEISERLARVESSSHALQHQISREIAALSTQLKTQGDYIHTLIERGG